MKKTISTLILEWLKKQDKDEVFSFFASKDTVVITKLTKTKKILKK